MAKNLKRGIKTGTPHGRKPRENTRATAFPRLLPHTPSKSKLRAENERSPDSVRDFQNRDAFSIDPLRGAP
jgi:hypothetical protein